MKKSKHTESQITEALKRAEEGVPVPEICRERISASRRFINGDLNMAAWMER